MFMRLSAALIGLVTVLGLGECLAATATANLKDGSTLVMSYAAMEILASSKIVLVGQPAHLKLFDKTKNTAFDASGEKIVVTGTSAGKSASPGIAVIRSAEVIGSPQIVYEAPDPATRTRVRTSATSTCANYDGLTETVHLKGCVKILSENPSLFEGPAQMTGDEAWIRLGTNLGPEDVRFRISSAGSASTITATPKKDLKTK